MATRTILTLTLASLLLLSLLPSSFPSAVNVDDDEDLSFLDEVEPEAESHDHHHHHHDDHHESDSEGDDSDFENYDDFDPPSDSNHEEEHESLPTFDETDVVVLTDRNFSSFVDDNKHVMVEFYAPWCGHCNALAPEYAAAATELREQNVKLAKVDATEENGLAENYEVQGFPTVFFFVDGEHQPYTGQRTKDAIVTWIKKKIGPGISNITTTEDAERVLTSESSVVLGFFDSLVGPDTEEFSAASKIEFDVNFYQTSNPNVAKLFHLASDVKKPAVVLVKREAEKVSYFDGHFKKSAIAEFVSANKLPLVIIFTQESASLIFESSIKKQILLFATSKDSGKVLPTFEEAAKIFKGKLIFVYVDVGNEEVGKPVAEYFGITHTPKVLGYVGSDDTNKYVYDGEVTSEKIKAFGEALLEDKLKPFYKSDPVPETNDEDVKIVVGNNFDDIVLDDSKDVLLEIYAPWCGHCQSLEPTYNKLAKHLRTVESLVIAKMDGTTNEHPRAKAEGFPTILFFPAGKKSSEPIVVESERTVKGLYKFLKEHASVPFKLQKTASSPASQDSNATESITSSQAELKDEL